MREWSATDPADFHHLSVLKDEVLQGLNLGVQGCYLDATLGGGGHSDAILAGHPALRVVGIDRDQQAIAAARLRLHSYGDRIQFWQGNFADYDPGEIRFDGILADLGVNSGQLDQGDRGFSLRQGAPLDMRMDQSQTLTAAQIINRYSERDLADIFYQYGEERRSRQIAQRIVARRPLQTTTELAQIVAAAMPQPAKGKKKWRHIHPATRVFQALRIVVNQELQSLTTFLEVAPTWLKPEGRIVMISFHSLEDRIVKHQFRQHPRLQVITKKPIQATSLETTANPRARSAKLRIAACTPEGVSSG